MLVQMIDKTGYRIYRTILVIYILVNIKNEIINFYEINNNFIIII